MHRVTLLLAVVMSGCGGTGGNDAGSQDSGHDAGRPPPKCLGPDSGLGDPCVCPSDCGSTALCLPELQYGYAGGICLKQGEDGGVLGMPTCDATRPCRAGWVCSILPPGPEGQCQPLCAADSDCPSSGHCDVYTGLCQDERSGLGFGEVCERDAACKSADCNIIASGLGLCRSYCDVTRDACPDDGTCQPLSNPVAGETLGRCESP